MDIADFVEARLAEWAAPAEGGGEWRVGHHRCADTPAWDPCVQPCDEAASCEAGRCQHKLVLGEGEYGICIYDEGGHSEGDALHIALHDPATVLREVAAMRAILAEYRAVRKLTELTGGDQDRYREWVVRHLAGIWSDHPGYRPEWAPKTADAR